MKKLWKSGVALVLVCALMFTQFNTVNVFANTSVQAEESETKEQITVSVTVGVNGKGTADDPYTIKDASELPEVIEEGDVYALTDDITLESGQYIKDIKGTLDGKGHTITLADTYLADKVEGTIENLGVTSTSEITLPDESGSMANTVSGTIVNSYSTAKLKPTTDTGDLGGMVGTMSGATISNCYFAGTIDGFMSGGITYTSSSSQSTISNCYFSAGYAPASMEYSATASKKVNCGKMTEAELKTSDAIEKLNTDITDTGFEWSLPTDGSNNGLPVLTVPSDIVDKSQLVAQIEAAQKITNDDYTDKSWNALQEALAEAIKVNSDDNATKSQVTKATNNLLSAISNLKNNKPTKPVALPTDDSKINHIKTADDLNYLSSSSGKYYVLDNDITITESDYYFSTEKFNGVLDGKGHSIKIDNLSSSIFSSVSEDGVIQNVYFTGTMNVGQGSSGPLGSNMSGAIINCYTDISGTGTCGFARRLTDAGIVSNSYSVSEGKAGAFFNQYGTNDTAGEGQLINTYWLETLDNSVIPESALVNSYSETKDYMKSLDFVSALNENKGENGVSWGRNGNTGYPYFGESQDYNPGSTLPANKYTVKFTKFDNTVATVENQNLEISCNDVDGSNIAGSLSLEGVPSTSTIEWSYESVEPSGAIMVGSDGGVIRVDKAGTAVVKATETKEDGSSEVVAAFNLKAYNKDVEEIKAYIDGQDVTNGEFTVKGSEIKTVKMEVKYKNEDKFVAISPRRFSLKVDDESFIENIPGSNSFNFKKAGTSKITAIYSDNTDLKADVTLTSEYVAVKSVTPAINDSVTIHGRNANSTNGQDFVPDYSSVIVDPANATNAANYTIESSDKTIGEYVPSMVIGYVPYKAGTVTYTATIKDTNPNGTENVVSGSKYVTYKYLNPLISVTTDEKEITIKANEESAVNLTFTGEKSEEGYSVTEPELNWTYSTDGIAKIERKTAYQWKRDESAPDNNNWLPGTDYYVYGLSEGTVTATGTPVDKTNNVEPVVLTIKVEASEQEAPDLTALTNKGLEGFLSYAEKNVNQNYDINGAWNLYTLARAGKSITIQEANKYYDAVVEASKNWTVEGTKPTDMEKAALVLSLINRDITNVDGVNIAQLIYNSEKLSDGANELAYALLALDARNTVIPSDAKWSREKIIAELKKFQNEDGGIGWTKGSSDVDTTAMVLQALGRYQNNEAAKEIIEKALTYIESKADANYDYGNANTTAMVVLALTSLNKDVTTTIGTKYKNTLTALMSYYSEDDGAFVYLKGGKVNQYATIQAVWALTSYKLYTEGKDGYWNLNNVKIKYEGEDEYYASLVTEKIAAIGTVTEESEDAIKEARAAYDALTSAQKKLVTNYDVLDEAELQLEIIKGTAVTTKFSLVGDDVHGSSGHVSYSTWIANATITVKSGSKASDVIVKAFKQYGYSIIGSTSYISGVTTPSGVSLKAFDNGSGSGWMYAVNGKSPNVGISGYKVSKDDNIILYYVDDWSNAKVPTVEDPADNQKAVDAVIKKISEIGEVTESSENLIKEARASYDALTDAQKELITNYDVLVQAEAQLENIKDNAVSTKFTLVGDDVHGTKIHTSYTRWISNITVKVRKDATAGDVITKGLKAKGYEAEVNAEYNYITAITTPTGTKLAAFDNGSNSGWMYAVNGEAPSVGMADYVVKENDAVILYYVDNYMDTKIPAMDAETENKQLAAEVTEKIASIGKVTKDSEAAIKEARAAYDSLTATQKSLVTNFDVLEEAELQLDIIKGNVIQTKFTLVGDDVHGTNAHKSYTNWINDITVTVKNGATVSDVIAKALKDNGYSSEGTTNYISAIKTPSGITLGEFDNGPRSGWMYAVNGKAPNVGIADYKVKAGDTIKFYYVDDYTKDDTPTIDASGDTHIKKLSPATVKVAKTAYNIVKLTWTKADNATKYQVYRKVGKNSKFVNIATTTSLKYTDKKVKTGKKYYYKVVAVNEKGETVDSKTVKAIPKAKKLKVKAKKKAGRTVLSWKKVKGATGYKVYRSTKKNGKYKKVKTITKKSLVTFKAKKSNKKYYYKVVAYKK
ncbi:MAG: DUF4430 domain-containing protein [Eubacterium ventriosum]|uniref:DUF4430 domain-containing protein n=1 Tax=Eubacterium ventriosum TaxID=39496 RepID=UPI001DDF6DB4|nr:DUF4430 domain-containing protein [Eubacterium ventriosum]MBD9054978.1 DUF4430 domain-containing protein [Eubacterium ventriosum]